jgi:hypothetical protein
VQDQTPKVTLQDARDFIEEAKAKVARQEENEKIGIGFDGGGGGADQSSS